MRSNLHARCYCLVTLHSYYIHTVAKYICGFSDIGSEDTLILSSLVVAEKGMGCWRLVLSSKWRNEMLARSVVNPA